MGLQQQLRLFLRRLCPRLCLQRQVQVALQAGASRTLLVMMIQSLTQKISLGCSAAGLQQRQRHHQQSGRQQPRPSRMQRQHRQQRQQPLLQRLLEPQHSQTTRRMWCSLQGLHVRHL
jgi:hypothetical protein